MNRKMVIFIAIAIPVVIVLITAIIVITLSINTVREGKMCVALNKREQSVNDKVYTEGTWVISPVHHFSAGLPVKSEPINAGLECQADVKNVVTDENATEVVNVFIVFKFYVEEKNAHKFFKALKRGYKSSDVEIASAVNQFATDTVNEIIGEYTCQEYLDGYLANKTLHEEKWISKFNEKVQARFTGFPFSLDAKKPIQAVIFFNSCENGGRKIFPHYDED